MCELFGLTSRRPTRATFSLDTFAGRGARGRTTIDGWGIAIHDGRDVRLYKEPEPAGDSAWLSFIGQRHAASRVIISHIRRATMGGISLGNTQPFIRELGGVPQLRQAVGEHAKGDFGVRFANWPKSLFRRGVLGHNAL